MRINIIILCALMVITGLWTYLANRTSAPNNIVSPKFISDFDYTTLDGQKGKLHNHKGSVILLHFWATWCAPCLVELPTLIDLAKSQDNLIILGIAVNDKTENINRFLKKIDRKIPPNFIVALDTEKDISAKIFETKKLPESFLINTDLTLERKIIGAQDDWNSDEWRQEIDRLSHKHEDK